MNEEELADLLAGGSPDTAEPTGADARARALRDLLAGEAIWEEPAPGGAETFEAAWRAEVGGSSEPHGSDSSSHPGGSARRRYPRQRVLLGAAAAVVVLAVAAVGILRLSDDNGDDDTNSDELVAPSPGEESALSGTELAPEAAAVATVIEWRTGVAIELDITRLPPAGPGEYYQGWVRGPEGAVTIGTFHMDGGDGSVELWSGVELDDYPEVTVTLQVEGDGPESSGEVVLEGQLTP